MSELADKVINTYNKESDMKKADILLTIMIKIPIRNSILYKDSL